MVTGGSYTCAEHSIEKVNHYVVHLNATVNYTQIRIKRKKEKRKEREKGRKKEKEKEKERKVRKEDLPFCGI